MSTQIGSLRLRWNLYRIKREFRRRSLQAREMLLAVDEKRTTQKEIPKELVEKAKAIVGRRPA